MGTCAVCGRPLERADDFWYCDNPDCSSQSGANPPTEYGPSEADSGQGPDREPADPPAPRRAARVIK
jgi:hypothetical protein